jgi:hypothetical protein
VGLGPVLDTLKRCRDWMKPALGIASFEAEMVKGGALDLGGELGCRLQEGARRFGKRGFWLRGSGYRVLRFSL